MSKHIENRQIVESISSRDERLRYINKCAIDDINRKILILRYIEFKSFDYIADTIGLSLSQVSRRYKAALNMLVKCMIDDTKTE